MARPFMFAALCQRAHPLKHSLAESKKQRKNLRQPKNLLAGSLVSRDITVFEHNRKEAARGRRNLHTTRLTILALHSTLSFACGTKIQFLAQADYLLKFLYHKQLDIQTQTPTHSVGTLLTSDQSVEKADTSTTQNKYKRRKSLLSAGLEPAKTKIKRLQTYVLYRSTSRIGEFLSQGSSSTNVIGKWTDKTTSSSVQRSSCHSLQFVFVNDH